MQLRLSQHPPEPRHWSPKTIALYHIRFEEGYDLGGLDPDYTAWLKSGHPDVGKSVSSSPAASVLSGANTFSSPDMLGDILVYPKPSQKSTFQEKESQPLIVRLYVLQKSRF